MQGIQDAARACDAAGRARAHVMTGDYAWPRNYVSSLDELHLHGVPAEQVIGYGYSFLDAAIVTVYGGTFPPALLGEAIAEEDLAEGEANAAAARLIDSPNCATRRRAFLSALTKQMARAEFVRRVLLTGQA